MALYNKRPVVSMSVDAEDKKAGTLRTENVELVDTKGNLRSQLYTLPGDVTIFLMQDGEDNSLLNITVMPGSSYLGISQRTKPGKGNPFKASIDFKVDNQKPTIDMRDRDFDVIFSKP